METIERTWREFELDIGGSRPERNDQTQRPERRWHVFERDIETGDTLHVRSYHNSDEAQEHVTARTLDAYSNGDNKVFWSSPNLDGSPKRERRPVEQATIYLKGYPDVLAPDGVYGPFTAREVGYLTTKSVPS